MRLGKKLFKVIRIELESKKSKQKFLKKAKRKSGFAKENLFQHKLAHSETTRMQEKPVLGVPAEITRNPDEKTILTQDAQIQILEATEGTQLNTTNINNTEEIPSTTQCQKKNHTEQAEPERADLELAPRRANTDLDAQVESKLKDFAKTVHLNVKDLMRESVSGSEIDLEGVFNAEKNEFIRVMVSHELTERKKPSVERNTISITRGATAGFA